MYEFWQLATISLFITYGHTTQNQACFSLFHTLNACKIFINMFYND